MQDSGKKGGKVEKIPLEIEIIEKKIYRILKYTTILQYNKKSTHKQQKTQKFAERRQEKKTMFRALASRAKNKLNIFENYFHS